MDWAFLTGGLAVVFLLGALISGNVWALAVCAALVVATIAGLVAGPRA